MTDDKPKSRRGHFKRANSAKAEALAQNLQDAAAEAVRDAYNETGLKDANDVPREAVICMITAQMIAPGATATVSLSAGTLLSNIIGLTGKGSEGEVDRLVKKAYEKYAAKGKGPKPITREAG